VWGERRAGWRGSGRRWSGLTEDVVDAQLDACAERTRLLPALWSEGSDFLRNGNSSSKGDDDKDSRTCGFGFGAKVSKE
jgi:hypothetical protein